MMTNLQTSGPYHCGFCGWEGDAADIYVDLVGPVCPSCQNNRQNQELKTEWLEYCELRALRAELVRLEQELETVSNIVIDARSVIRSYTGQVIDAECVPAEIQSIINKVARLEQELETVSNRLKQLEGTRHGKAGGPEKWIPCESRHIGTSGDAWCTEIGEFVDPDECVNCFESAIPPETWSPEDDC